MLLNVECKVERQPGLFVLGARAGNTNVRLKTPMLVLNVSK